MRARATVLALAALAGITLGGCTTTQLANFQADLNNFTAGVQSVNAAIAATSQQLYNNCKQIETAAGALQNLGNVVTTSTVARQSLAGANAAINAWCQAPPQDIASALATTAAMVVSTQQAVKAVQAGN